MLDPFIRAFMYIFDTVITLYLYVIIAAVVVSWLISLGVLNMYNPHARSLRNILGALTEPLFRHVRRVIPPFSGLDISPLVVGMLLVAFKLLVDGLAEKAL